MVWLLIVFRVFGTRIVIIVIVVVIIIIIWWIYRFDGLGLLLIGYALFCDALEARTCVYISILIFIHAIAHLRLWFVQF